MKYTLSILYSVLNSIYFKYTFQCTLKGYSSGQSHFSEINVKLAEENEFVTHFVEKCLETRENEQNVVLNESSEALGSRSEIVRILVLAMTTADDGVGGSNSVRRCCSFFVVLQTKWCFLGSLKAKQLILVSKIILTDPNVTSRDLHGRKPYKFGVQVIFEACRHSVQLEEIASRKY